MTLLAQPVHVLPVSSARPEPTDASQSQSKAQRPLRLLLLAALVQGGVTLYKMQAVDQRLAELIDNAVPSINEAQAINALVMRSRLWQFRYVTADTESERATSLKSADEMMRNRQAKAEAYRTLVASKEEQAIYDDLLAKLAVQQADWTVCAPSRAISTIRRSPISAGR